MSAKVLRIKVLSDKGALMISILVTLLTPIQEVMTLLKLILQCIGNACCLRQPKSRDITSNQFRMMRGSNDID
jgi:hypothetical protein